MGRSRKSGERFPSGKLKPQKKPGNDAITGAEWQRIRQHGKKLGADPRLVTELGRLNAFSELTQVQTTAGHRVAEIYGRYERLHGLKRSVRSPSYERAFGRAGDGDNAALIAATDAFMALQDAIDTIAPELRGPLEDLCVEDRSIPAAHYPYIRTLLDSLANKWGISRAGNNKGAGSAKRPPPVSPTRPADVTPEKPKRQTDREAFKIFALALRPDLDDAQLERAFELFSAVKDRARFNQSKARPAPFDARAISDPRSTKPVLKLKGEGDV